jgi:hypothetical protein
MFPSVCVSVCPMNTHALEIYVLEKYYDCQSPQIALFSMTE